MRCGRCGGLAIRETYEGTGERMPAGMLPGVRCLNCGCIEDAVITANRACPPQLELKRPGRARNWSRPGLTVTLEGESVAALRREGNAPSGMSE